MSVKSTLKNTTKKTTQATPKKVAVKAVKKAIKITYHNLILADFKACKNVHGAGASEYEAFKAVLLAVDLSQTAEIKAAQLDIKITFGDAMADSATIRCTMINNARKVEHGAVVDKHQVKGAGRAALETAINSVKSIRELRKALANAKPETLKDTRGGVRAAPTSDKQAVTKPTALERALKGVEMQDTRSSAFKAAVKILEYIAAQYIPLTDRELSDSVHATVKLLLQA